jgi:hypothetical protein
MLAFAAVPLALVPAALWLIFFYQQDRLEPEPVGNVVRMFVIGLALAGAIGIPLTPVAVDTVLGGAAAYVPCEASLGFTGINAALEPHSASSGLSPLLFATNLPLGASRRIRHGAAEAEVWPGSWTAEHIAIGDAKART